MSTGVGEASIKNHPVVSRERWVEERKKLLAREKELTHLRDQVARERRALPWVRSEKVYTFDTPEGARTLADLFEGRRQLMVQHARRCPRSNAFAGAWAGISSGCLRSAATSTTTST